MDSRLRTYKLAADYILKQTGGKVPLIGIILGSGLGRLADRIEEPIVIPYKTILGFPVSTAIGHKGNLIFGKLGGKYVIAMQGEIPFRLQCGRRLQSRFPGGRPGDHPRPHQPLPQPADRPQSG